MPVPAAAPPIVEEALAAPGRALEGPVREQMEGHFGQNLGAVLLHTDALAAASARAVGAEAYTVGRDVGFGQGRYRPQTSEGMRLLAHELTHTVQQRSAVALRP